MNDDIPQDGIINLKAEAERRQKQRDTEAAVKAAKEAAGSPNTDQLYEVTMKNGEVLQAAGMLMVTPHFFALGKPVSDTGGVDFNWAAPLDSVDFVVALTDADLEDE